jgi:acyl dehydratase
MKFAEFKPEMQIECGSHLVTEDEILSFAKKYDPQLFHVDVAQAQAGRWNGLIASGWMTCCIAMDLVVRRVLEGSESFGSPGVEELRWENPVRPGDTLRVSVTVLESRVSSSGRNGIVRWRWDVHTQRSQRVLTLIATSLFDVAGAARSGGRQELLS